MEQFIEAMTLEECNVLINLRHVSMIRPTSTETCMVFFTTDEDSITIKIPYDTLKRVLITNLSKGSKKTS